MAKKVIIEEILRFPTKWFSNISVFFMEKNGDGTYSESRFNNEENKKAYREAVQEAIKRLEVERQCASEEIRFHWSKKARPRRPGFVLKNADRKQWDIVLLVKLAEVSEIRYINTEEEAEDFAETFSDDITREMVGAECWNDLSSAVGKVMEENNYEFGEEEEDDEEEVDLMQIIIDAVR